MLLRTVFSTIALANLGTLDTRAIAQQNGTKDTFIDSREQSEMEAASEKTLDPIAGSPATGKSVA